MMKMVSDLQTLVFFLYDRERRGMTGFNLMRRQRGREDAENKPDAKQSSCFVFSCVCVRAHACISPCVRACIYIFGRYASKCQAVIDIELKWICNISCSEVVLDVFCQDVRTSYICAVSHENFDVYGQIKE